MTCKQSSGRGPAGLSWLVAPRRESVQVGPETPTKPEERPTTAPPPREDPHYPSHTPPSPDTKPYAPCPGKDDPEEEYPACRLPQP
jgi:hypothetical protein